MAEECLLSTWLAQHAVPTGAIEEQQPISIIRDWSGPLRSFILQPDKVRYSVPFMDADGAPALTSCDLGYTPLNTHRKACNKTRKEELTELPPQCVFTAKPWHMPPSSDSARKSVALRNYWACTARNATATGGGGARLRTSYRRGRLRTSLSPRGVR